MKDDIRKKKEIFVKSFGLIVIFISLIGCSTNNYSAVPTTNNANNIESIVVFPSLTPTIVLVENSTPTLSPNASSYVQTQQPLEDHFYKYCKNPIDIKLAENPQWVKLRCYTDEREVYKVISIDETKQWEISAFKLYGSKYYSLNNYYESYTDFPHWTHDGKYVYITFSSPIDPGIPFYNGSILYKMNLISGEIVQILPAGLPRKNFYSLSFSPDDRFLAYFKLYVSPPSLIVYNFQENKNQIVELDSRYNIGGDFLWSDSGKFLVFSAVYQEDVSDFYFSSVLLWDNENKTLQTLVDDFNTVLSPIEWIGESKIVLKERFSSDETKYEFNLNTKTLTLIK